MRRVLALMCVGCASTSFAQKEEIFGSGKPPHFREETMDRRFTKSKFAKILANGTDEPGCVQLAGGMFVALAELAPLLHKRDENFSLAPELQEALQTQLSTPVFPALAYLASMVRKVMIDKHMPDEWLTTAQALNSKVKLIDVAKLKMINEQLALADSSYFTISLLRQRYEQEVLSANSAIPQAEVISSFRDLYLDRDVAWSGATLIDIGINKPKGKKKKRYREAEPEELVAVLQWVPPEPRITQLNLFATVKPKIKPVTLYARLQPKQYTDIEKLHRGQRVMVKGRFWEMDKSFTEIELREGLVFDDRDWSAGVLLGRPDDVATCEAAVNELTGIAPQQPGGFNH